MLYNQRLQQIIDLPFDTKVSVLMDSGIEVSVFRPSELSNKFKDYDAKRNFQIWLHEGTRSFKPNHLRVMIDLYLRVRSRPDLKAALARAVDGVFYGEDPAELLGDLGTEKFEHFLNSLAITLQLSQLFIIEQEHSYHGESKYDPPTLFYQGWVRQVIDSEKEIDNLIMSIANRQPPAVKYTYADNKKHKKYVPDPEPLWWLS